MKVAIIVDNDLDDDVRVNKEIKMLKMLNYEVSVLCFGFKEKSYKDHNFPVTRIEVSRKLKNTYYFFNLMLPLYRNLWVNEVKKFLNAGNYDIVHTHDLYMSLPVRKGINRSEKSIPLVLDLHENFPIAYASYSWVNKNPLRKLLTRPKKWKKLEKSYLEAADGIVALSDSFQTELCDQYPKLKKRKWFILPNVQDIESFNEPDQHNKSLQDQTVFLYFGVLGIRRGIFDVMDAFIELQKKRKDIKLLLIGPIDKADRDLFDAKAKQLYKEVFEYIPWVPQKELLNYTQLSDVGLCPLHVNPQHESGVANKIFQYMFAQLPLLVSNCKPQMKVVQDNEIGKVFSDQKELLVQIEEFADTTHKDNETLGKKAKEVLLEKYSLESYVNGMKDFYEQLTK